MKEQIAKNLKGLMHDTGLFSAARKTVKTGYDKVWIRDNIYCTYGLEINDKELVIKTIQSLLDIFLKHEYKINEAIRQKPLYPYQYIHARFNPITLQEFHEEWGNKQNDSIGAFLFKVSDILDKKIQILRNMDDYRILQKLVFYLGSIEYWQDLDNGMWEENEELHASSVGACLAGLKKISSHVYVPCDFINKGQESLNKILPRESDSKEVDLSLLSLIFPYNIVTREQALTILENVEKKLVREKGVIRYLGDKYYIENGLEAEWCFGFPWLAIIYKSLGIDHKYYYYLHKAKETLTSEGEMPELYLGSTNVYNENTPLGWGQSLFLVALNCN